MGRDATGPKPSCCCTNMNCRYHPATRVQPPAVAVSMLFWLCCAAGVRCGTGTLLQFGRPTRVYGNGTGRTYGAVYADAFYSIVADGAENSVVFGVPGLGSKPTPVLLSESGGHAWRPWYQSAYVNAKTGYPFTAVRFNSSAIHDLGAACSSSQGVPQSEFSSSSIDTWHKHGIASHGSQHAAVSFESLPRPLNCSQNGVTADCFWLHAGGTAALRNGTLLTSAVPWLNGRFGATKSSAGIFAWHSTNGLRWTFRGTIALAAQFPTSGEGPNENDVTMLADGKTLLSIFRIDDGIDGGKVGAKNYRSVRSTDDGRT